MFAVAADAIKTAQLIEREPIIAAPSRAPPAGGCECVGPQGTPALPRACIMRHREPRRVSVWACASQNPPPPRVSTHLWCRCADRRQLEREAEIAVSARRGERGGGEASREANLIKVNVILVNAV